MATSPQPKKIRVIRVRPLAKDNPRDPRLVLQESASTVDLRFDLGDGASHFTVNERRATASHGFDEILDQGLVWKKLVQGSGFRVQGSGFRVQGSGFNMRRSASLNSEL
jgi:hypothetical protein